ncbi:NAD(P)-binding domain-containing protein [Amnibacterium kyonggiense]|uniref:Putative short-subunit dehydrogenase-like oxidoreductase (DUF2520 family) n=1 Tax=Amnibacterium kyonggiense TaxID=595671 RepID=A0A4R7FQG7_9MICO|nr:NAD(P)-binding domain-containing protein [Amnibacterium kyonggiense]TDS80022.1 putative short-subunit dehydrogenase-like oxidoreductase (DUF2520 family) [Amnibacterium kyonggiense]
MRPAGRLGVGVIGAGRVGPVLGAALAGAGHALVGIAAVSQESRDRAEAMLPTAPILPVPDLVERSELVLLAVPDAELPGLVQGLADAGVWVAGQLVVHTAPGLGTEVLLPAVRQGAIPVALSPAMAFTGTSIDVLRLREARCAVTAPGPVLPIGQALAVEMGCEPVVVAEEDRAAWAQALDDVVGPVELAVRSAARGLARLGVEDPDAVLGPIARTALDRALLRVGRPDEGEDPR